MNQWKEAKDAAETAVECDGTYTKAWWRLGQAQSALGEFDQAVKALQKATKLEPNNKALQKELVTMEKKAKDAAEKKAKEEQQKKEQEENKANATTTTTTTTKSSSSTSTETKKGPEPMEVDSKGGTVDGTTFSKSEHVKGYKIVNGKKTSYFHNELTEEAKQLIGDIAPKKLEVVPDPTAASTEEGRSAWNKAGTWEERDVTKWACEAMQSQLSQITYAFPSSSPAPGATVTTKKATVTGHASVATVRGKKRYIYELILKLEWQFEHEDVDAHGILNFPDVDGTCEVGQGYDATNWDIQHASNDSMRPLLEQFVHKQGWRNAVHDAIDDWVRLFKETY